MSQIQNPINRKAALVIIGNEILSGRTQDINTSWIAENLQRKGIKLFEVRIVPDIEVCIVQAVNELRATVDYLFTTGGIGPTHDDITAASIAKAFGVELERNAEAMDMLEKNYGSEKVTPARAKMAMIPAGAALIVNPVSGAPGFIIGNVHVMAGIPRIMQAMLENVLPLLESGKPFLSNTISCGLRESVLAQPLGELQQRYPAVEMGSYPHYRGGNFGVNLVLRSVDEEVLKTATQELVNIIRSLDGEPQALGLQAPLESW